MREIKFRGRALDNFEDLKIKKHSWIYGDLVREGDKFWIVGEVVEANEEYIALEQWIPVDPKTVGQFTGLLDRNNVEIYEGDIIYRFTLSMAGTIYSERKGQVRWNKRNSEYYFDTTLGYNEGSTISLTCYYSDNKSICYNTEVIGNIWENPELLKDKNE